MGTFSELGLNCFSFDSIASSRGSSPSSTMSVRASQSTFNRLTPEIREKIFEPNLNFLSGSKEFPPLIAALRGEQHLYHEALAILFKINSFKLSGWANEQFDDTHEKCLARIKHLTVFIDKARFYPNKGFDPDAQWFRYHLSRLTGLEDLVIHCASHVNSNVEIITDFVRYMPRWLVTTRVSKKLTIIIPYCQIWCTNIFTWLPIAVRDRVVEKNINKIDLALGVKGNLVKEHRCEHVDTPDWGKFKHHRVDEDEWVWEAKEDTILDFTRVVMALSW